MADLPPALISEILLLLPVKFLLRFRCVSKSWRSLIDDPHFIKSHLKHSLQNPNSNQTLILRDCYLYSVNFPALDRATVIDHPLKSDHYGTELLGSCNGLLCLSNGEDEGEGTILYNPATRKQRELPFTPIEFPVPEYFTCCDRIVYGFGYDHVHDDYKVVRIIQFFEKYPNFYDSEVKVYSLRAGSWKRIADFPHEYYVSYKRGWGVHVNGCLHWVVTRNPDSYPTKLIVGFDLGSEELRVVPQPEYLPGEFHMNVGVLQGCLCVLSNYFNVRTDVWVMKEYGVKQSWVKLFTVSQIKIGSFEYVRPLAMSNDRSEVLLEQDCSKLVWFNLHRQKTRSVNFPGMPSSLDAEMSMESLVPLDSHKKKRKKRPKKKRNEPSEQANCGLPTLPSTLVFNILSRLPAKMLLQLQCVRKAWNNVIQDPDFAKLHLQASGKAIDNLNLISVGEQMHLLDFNLLNNAVQIKHPLKFGQGFTDVFGGSCNGLICLANRDKEIALWNPLTGHHQNIPTTKFQSRKDSSLTRSFIYGFGYDPVTDDYKIVRVLQLYSFSDYDFSDEGDSDSEKDQFVGSEVHVFSLKTKYWRRIQSFPYVLCYLCSGVLSNGSLYWVARQRDNLDSASYVIIAFDLGSEKCRVVPQPSYEDIHFGMSLEVLGGSLCVLCHYPKHGVDIWVLKNYETGSWQKLISITQPKPIKVFENIKPLAHSKNGRELLLLLDYEKLIWYNLQKKAIRHANINGLPSSFNIEVFSGSLIDPNNVTGNYEEDMGEQLNITHRSGLILTQVKQSGQVKRSLGSLPKKLLSHIFSRLPVKTLLQAQRVCKTWYNLINDPEFIKAQLEVSSKCKRGLSLILSGEKFVSVDFKLLDKAIEIRHPLLCFEGFTNLVGSSNGLVCLSKDNDFALWNPWTGKYENVPPVNFLLQHLLKAFAWFIHGFGYDPTSNDYKIVCILQQHSRLKGGRVQSEVQVYSLKTKSWKCISCPPFMVCSPCSGVLANGKLHWVARLIPDLFDSSNTLIAFDLGTEKCREMTQPNYVHADFEMSLGVLGGSLCLLCHYPKRCVDIWVMTDYERESWAKLASISQHNVMNHFGYLKPLAYSEDGTEVLLEQDNEKLLWYNLRKKTVKYVKIRGLPVVFETVMCLGSLVHIGNAAKTYNVMDEQPSTESKNQRDKKKRNDSNGFLTTGFKLKL